MVGKTPIPAQITAWVKNTVLSDLKRLEIRVRHIEQDRRWREIRAADVLYVLEHGSADSVRLSDETVFWRGQDSGGRTLELMCSMVMEEGQDTLIVLEAYLFRVGTAYEPGKDDDAIRAEWLARHPEYELDVTGKRVIRKVGTH